MKSFTEYLTEATGKKEVYPDTILLWTTGFMQVLTREDDKKYRIAWEATRRNPIFRNVAKQPLMDNESNRDVPFIKEKIKSTGAKIRLMSFEDADKFIKRNVGKNMTANFRANRF